MSLQPPDFKHITEDALREWKTTASAGFKLPGRVPMPRFVYELCWALVRGDLPLQKCKVALDSAEFSGQQPVAAEEVASVFADIIAHLVQDPMMTGEYRARLVKLAKWLVESAVVPARVFQERCEEDFLWESEMSKIKAQELKAKEVRVNTRLLYQQTKFNLLREESEGYAKLVTLLCQCGLETMQGTSSVAAISLIKSLIGHFDLDPNRVFDIVLECFELYPDSGVFYDLIPIFPKSHASQILGFKFQYYQRMEVKDPVPFSLYRLSALLIKAGLIDLDNIYAHLLPEDVEAFEHYDAFLAKRLDEVNKIGKINLAATGKDLMDEEKQEGTADLCLALDLENEAVLERVAEPENNQCLGLLMGFLCVDDWHHANILFDRLSHLNPVEHVEVCDGLIRVIEKTISPAYAVSCQIHSLNQSGISAASSMDTREMFGTVLSPTLSLDLPAEFFQMLSVAGPYLYRAPLLLQKICRVLRVYYLSAEDPGGTSGLTNEVGELASREVHSQQKDVRVKVEAALGTCILPSLQLIPANPAIGQEIWEVMCLLPYETRYRLYGEWEKEDERLPVVLAARQIAKLETRRILKRLAKENLKQKGRMVAKLAHANPMTVLRTIVHQIEAYRDMITPVVDAFKYLTQLEYDILEYVVIERLAHAGREKLKDDGLNLSDWLQSLASFWGHLCKKYPSMELRGLFQYLVNQLKKGIEIELVLLQELIQQMANVQYTENMTEEQLDALAGSETLRCQATSFGLTRNNKALLKSTNRLRDSLLPKDEPKLAIPLLLLICQHRSMVVANADGPHIKMVSEQLDRCHGTLLQYVEFLYSALTPATIYAQLIPTLHDLVHKFHLEPEAVFLIYRPIMRLFKSTSRTEAFWPVDCVEESNVRNSEDSEPDKLSADLVLDLGQSHSPIRWSELMITIRSMLPPKAWNSLSPELYATFWGLTLYDLYTPRSRYESEIAKQHSALKSLEELSDNSSSAITKRKKDKERIQELLDKLTGEFQKHEQHVASVSRRLSHEKDRWLSSCTDMLKINMEFFQRCIFPRCIFSMSDAVYCATFVHTLHLLGTPFFNTVHHIDIFICKTLHPMICCCTEYEAGRLGRFLYETLKMAYYWKSDEAIYDRECGNKPGFAIYYRFPNSQRVSFSQFVRIHLKWSSKITKLFIQCLESTEYMEIRNALITLTKISSIFPVTRKSGVNLEKRVVKIKSDEREDLKVLATSVSATLAARKSSWVSEEEFTMGYFIPKAPASPAKSLAGNHTNLQNGSAMSISHSEAGSRRNGSSVSDPLNSLKDQGLRAKLTDGRHDRLESLSSKTDLQSQKVKGGLAPSSDAFSSAPVSSAPKLSGSSKSQDDIAKVSTEETVAKLTPKASVEAERPKRSTQTASRQARLELIKDDGKAMKATGRVANQCVASVGEKDSMTHHSTEGRRVATSASVVAANGSDVDGGEVSDVSRSRPSHSPFHEDSVKHGDKQQKRPSIVEEQDRLKRRKGENEVKDGHALDVERTGSEEHGRSKPAEKLLDKSREKAGERLDKDHREKIDRSDRSREAILEKARERSLERYGRERSIERASERGDRVTDRLSEKGRDDKVKDERSKPRHSDLSSAKPRSEEHVIQSLPPPPPLSPSTRPESVGSIRRDEEVDRRAGSARYVQKLSPRHDNKDHRHSDENLTVIQEDTKRRREDDLRERKHDDWDGSSTKVEDQGRDKGSMAKDDIDGTAASKRRKLKRELPTDTSREYSPVVPPVHPPVSSGVSQPFDGRERGDRKTTMVPHRSPYMEETGPRLHGKEAANKITRRETDVNYEREWEDEKRQRNEAKRKHRK